MKPTQQLHDLGQSLWLDNITRELLTSGTLRRYRDECSITGLTSNPTIFDLAIRNGNAGAVRRWSLATDIDFGRCWRPLREIDAVRSATNHVFGTESELWKSGPFLKVFGFRNP